MTTMVSARRVTQSRWPQELNIPGAATYSPAQSGTALLRDRTRSYPDCVYGTHVDAAFADFLWLASYSVRFGGPNFHAHQTISDSDQGAAYKDPEPGAKHQAVRLDVGEL